MAAVSPTCEVCRGHGALTPSMRPERSRTIRPQRAAKRGIVRDQHQRGAAFGMAGEQKIDDLLAGVLVEIAGRLVGHHDGRIGRQRARHRHALLLAAGQLGRIMLQPLAEADADEFVARALLRVGERRRAPAAPPRFPARSWSGSDGTTGTRCRRAGRGSAPARPRRARSSPRRRPSTDPVSVRSSPAITISSVDLPEPDGPTRPIASPLPIFRSMSLRIWTRAAPCPSERLTPASSIAACAIAGGAWEGAFMVFYRSRPRTYGAKPARVQWLAALALAALVCAMAPARGPPTSGRSISWCWAIR